MIPQDDISHIGYFPVCSCSEWLGTWLQNRLHQISNQSL